MYVNIINTNILLIVFYLLDKFVFLFDVVILLGVFDSFLG